MQVRMKKTLPGSPNGITVQLYEEGHIYDLPQELFLSFKSMGVIDMVECKEVRNSPENKEIKGAYENKEGGTPKRPLRRRGKK